MNDNGYTGTWQDAAETLLDMVRRQHRFISDYMPNDWEICEEYALITKDLADAIGMMNQHLEGEDYGCIKRAFRA